MTLELINPETLHAPAGHTRTIVATAHAMVFIAGQEPEYAQGTLVGAGRPGPPGVRQPRPALAAAGARPGQVAEITIYVVHHRPGHLPVIEQAHAALVGDHKPADTLVGAEAPSGRLPDRGRRCRCPRCLMRHPLAGIPPIASQEDEGPVSGFGIQRARAAWPPSRPADMDSGEAAPGRLLRGAAACGTSRTPPFRAGAPARKAARAASAKRSADPAGGWGRTPGRPPAPRAAAS
jgi:enamine deaminase RidA (YjgF/YER057c/UK114 family)